MNALRGWRAVVLACLAAQAVASGEENVSTPDSEPFALEKAPREHVEDVVASGHVYQITMGGTLDGFNTVDYLETYGGHMRQEARFEPNAYLVLENTGDVDVVHPRVVINGRRAWHSADDILAGIFVPGMTDAEKAMAIFGFASSIEVQAHDNNRRVGPPFPADGTEHVNQDTSHPSRNTFQERANPVKAANSYYCSGCSLSAANFVVLCRHAGLAARAVWMCPLDRYTTHCVAEAWYDGGWHLFDPERRAFYLEQDNATVASYETLHENPVLAERTHDGGFAAAKLPTHAPDYARYYPPHVMPVEQWLSAMDLTLRPGEQFVWRWRHDGKYRYGSNVRKKSHLVPYQLANGKLIYRPRLAGDAFRKGITAEHNIVAESVGAGRPLLHPHVVDAPAPDGEMIEAMPGHVVYKVRSPHPIVGGRVGGRFARKTDDDACRIYVSVRDSDWLEVWAAQETGESDSYVRIDHVLDPLLTPALYEYYVKIELRARAAPADASLLDAYIETDLQMAATALPALSAAVNRVLYEDDSPAGRRVRLTHGWRESSENTPPLPPKRPVAPEDGAEIDVLSLKTLAWEAATDPDGDAIADYHVQVSPRPDVLYPVSPDFDRILFSPDPEWPVPEGWLLEGRPYYWRVRARDGRGAWSEWGAVWTFRCVD